MIKINDWITIDEEAGVIHIKEALIKLHDCKPKPEYLEPFKEVEEPDVWVMIKKSLILARVGKKYMCNR